MPYPPFYRPRGNRDYRWEKEEKTRDREGPLKVPGLPLSLEPTLLNMADGARNSTFVDPDRAMLWFRSASGRVPSYFGGLCGVPGCRAMTLRGADGEVTIRPSL